MATVLGLKITKRGYKNHIQQRRRQGNEILSNLYRFKNLSTKNKLRSYNALVVSKITYTPVPIHCLSHTNILVLHRLQNRDTRFIANTAMLGRKTSSSLHEKLHLHPINVTLFEKAEVWTKIRNTMRADD